MMKRRYWILYLVLVGLIGGGGISVAQDQDPPAFPTRTPSGISVTVTPFPTLTPGPSATSDGTPPPFPTITPTASATPAPLLMGERATVQLTCHAEPKWTFLVNVRRGPSNNWGVIRQLVHNLDNHEMRVFGQDQTGDWYHVHLAAPYDDQVGWVWRDGINLFGACDDLPIYAGQQETTIEAVPPVPDPVPMPNWAREHVRLSEYDRVWLLNAGMLYIRHEVPGDIRERIQSHTIVLNYDDRRVRMGVTIGAQPGVTAVPVTQMAQDSAAYIAINGDFYAGNYFPQGITVIDGNVVTAPKLRAAFGITQDRQPFIGYFTLGWTWPASVTAANGEAIPLQLMNLPCDLLWLCLYSHHRANRLPTGFGGIRVLLSPDYEVLDIIDGQGVDIPDGHFVLRGGLTVGDWLLENVAIGDTLQIDLPTDPDWRDFESVISGGPRLLEDGKLNLDCYPEPQDGEICEEFDFEFRDSNYGLKSLPRSAVGYNQDNLIYIIMVEGYEIDDSGGVTRQELADLFLQYGASEAMEFDGGGSSSLYVRDGLISDTGFEGERRVSNALLAFWEDDEE